MKILAIEMLGPLLVIKDGQPATFSYDKVRALLAYLCAERARPVPRSRLAALLWPDQPQTAAQDSLRQALSRLRALTDERETALFFLIAERDSVQINPQYHITIDLDTFQACLARTEAHRHRSLQTCPACARQLEAAAALIRGRFLEDLSLPDSDLFESWATALRERVNLQAVEILSALTSYHERAGNSEAALRYATRQIEIDPYHEPSHRSMMRALVRSGQRSQAAAHYNRLKRLLDEELGIRPATETLSLFESIKQGSELTEGGPAQVRGLPSPLNPMVGRSVELSELGVWLADPERRLISVVGPGGMGKTRLVNEAARKAAGIFADGGVYVPLSTAASNGGLLQALVESLGLSGEGRPQNWGGVRSFFQNREQLLILDGFEHVLEERQRVSELLEAHARLVILVTTRERLNLAGEWIFGLGGLEFPPPTLTSQIEAYSSVLLFCQSAKRLNQAFGLTEDNRAAIGEICRMVGGVPLAIRLAASWTRSLPCPEIAAEIHRNLDFLAVQGGTLDTQSSMRAVFEQSWKLLDEEERQVFPRLSVFQGGFDRASAAAVAGASLDQLERLVDKSLLRITIEGRYDLHDLLLQYGEEKLGESGTTEACRQRHFEYFYLQAEKNEAILRKELTLNAFLWLIRESANLRAALGWALSPREESAELRSAEMGHRLTSWMHQDTHQTGLHIFARNRTS